MSLAIPPYFLLIPYGLFLLAVLFFGLINIMHLVKYGAHNFVGFLATFGFIAVTAAILFFTWNYMPVVDWMEPVPLLSSASKLPF